VEVFQVFVTKSRGFSSFEEKKTVFQVFVTKSGGFWRKKTPKVEDWKSILIEILTFEKKTTKSGGFSSFDKKSNKKKKLPKWRFFKFS